MQTSHSDLQNPSMALRFSFTQSTSAPEPSAESGGSTSTWGQRFGPSASGAASSSPYDANNTNSSKPASAGGFFTGGAKEVVGSSIQNASPQSRKEAKAADASGMNPFSGFATMSAVAAKSSSPSPREMLAPSALPPSQGVTKPFFTFASTPSTLLPSELLTAQPPRQEASHALAPSSTKLVSPMKLPTIDEANVTVEEPASSPPPREVDAVTPAPAPVASVSIFAVSTPRETLVERREPVAVPPQPAPPRTTTPPSAATAATAGGGGSGSDDVEAVTQAHNGLLTTVHAQIAQLGALSHNVQARVTEACNAAELAAFASGEMQLQVQRVQKLALTMNDGSELSPADAVSRFERMVDVGLLPAADATGTDDASAQHRLDYARKIIELAVSLQGIASMDTNE